MLYTIKTEDVTDNLRSLMKSSFIIPDGNPITLAGEEVQAILLDKLPMGLIEFEGAQTTRNNPAVKDLTITLNVYCWMIRQTDAGADDLSVIRSYLRTLGRTLMNNKRLNGSATYLKVKGFNWSGVGREWPVSIQSGLQAGYVNAEIQISV